MRRIHSLGLPPARCRRDGDFGGSALRSIANSKAAAITACVFVLLRSGRLVAWHAHACSCVFFSVGACVCVYVASLGFRVGSAAAYGPHDFDLCACGLHAACCGGSGARALDWGVACARVARAHAVSSRLLALPARCGWLVGLGDCARSSLMVYGLLAPYCPIAAGRLLGVLLRWAAVSCAMVACSRKARRAQPRGLANA